MLLFIFLYPENTQPRAKYSYSLKLMGYCAERGRELFTYAGRMKGRTMEVGKGEWLHVRQDGAAL